MYIPYIVTVFETSNFFCRRSAMGSFNVACSVSNLSIGAGDKVAFLPLIEARYPIKLPSPITMVVSNQGMFGLYNAFSFPIYGEYNDYGSLENIERNPTVEAIEAFFGIPIDKFMDQVTRNWCGDDKAGIKNKSKQSLLDNVGGMFVVRDIYEFMTKKNFSEWGDAADNTAYEGGDVDKDTLEHMGFVFVKKEDKIDRYNKIYKHPSSDKFFVGSDGTWMKIFNHKNGVVKEHIYHPNQFIKAWKELTDVELPFDKKLSKYSIKFDSVQRLFQENAKILKKLSASPILDRESQDKRDKERHKETLKILKQLQTKKKSKPKPLSKYAINKLNLEMDQRHLVMNLEKYSLNPGDYRYDIFDSYTPLERLYVDQVINGSIKDEVIRFWHFYRNCFDCNILLRPTANGPQCGNDKASFALAKEIYKAAKSKIDERKKYEKEEELEEEEI